MDAKSTDPKINEDYSGDGPATPASLPARRPRLGATNQALIVGVLAAIAGWFTHVLSERNERDAALPPLPNRLDEQTTPTVVTVSPVSVRPIAQTIDIIGTLHCFEEIPISTMVDGTVVKLHCDVATRVRSGELLVEIDSENYALDVEEAERSLQVELAKLGLNALPVEGWKVESIPAVVQAQARLNLAETRFQRLRKLAEERAASEADQDSALSEFESNKAERDDQILAVNASLATIRMKQTALQIAQRKLKDTQIIAPTPTFADGGKEDVPLVEPLFVVSERQVSEGAYLRAGTQVLTLVVDARLKLRSSVPEKFGASVRLGQPATITTASHPDPIPGQVTNIYPTVDPKKRTFDVEIQVPNLDGLLKPGNFAKASIQVGHQDQSVTVPLESIVGSTGITKLFVAQDGVAQEYIVRLGIQMDDWVEIIDPPFPATVDVITSGQQQLFGGRPIHVREAESNDDGENATTSPPAPSGDSPPSS